MKMEFEKIERFVSDVLTLSAVEREGGEPAVGQALYHVLMAAGIYDLMGEEERALTGELMKKLQFFFRSKFSLKERKERKKKENFPPNPLLKEKDKNRKEEKNLPTVADARETFRKECLSYIDQYDAQRVAGFYRHWTEEDSKGRMRFEKERFWNTETRIKRWMENQYTIFDTEAAERLNKARGKQQKEQVETEQQKLQAAQREEANTDLERQIAERKAGAVSYEEYKAMKKKTDETNK